MTGEELQSLLTSGIGSLLNHRLVRGRYRAALQGLRAYLPTMPKEELDRMAGMVPVQSGDNEESEDDMARQNEAKGGQKPEGKGGQEQGKGGGPKKFGSAPSSFSTHGHDASCAPVRTCCITVTTADGDPVAHVGACEETGSVLFEFKTSTGDCICLTGDEMRRVRDHVLGNDSA